MTDKVTLSNVSSFQNDSSAVATVNANSAAITTAMDNTLSRDGTSPNQMGANLDMNSNRILNLPAPISLNEPVRFQDVTATSISVSFPSLVGDVTAPSNNGALTTTIAAGAVTNSKMANMAANTLKGNPTTSSAAPTDFTIDGLTLNSSPSSNDEFMIYDIGTTSLQKTTLSAVQTATAPTGSLIASVMTSHTGYLLCGGQAVSRTTYANLFSAISTTYGVGDGSTTFNVPDMRGRVLAGADNMAGSVANRLTSGGSGITGTTIGATGGQETFTQTSSTLPSHTHTATVTDPGHTHAPGSGMVQFFGSAGTSNSTDAAGGAGSNRNTATASATTGITVGNSSTGSGTAHTITQPTIVVNWFIKT